MNNDSVKVPKTGFIGTRPPSGSLKPSQDSSPKPTSDDVRFSRITVVETVCYQPAGEEAVSFESRYNRKLVSTEEEPYRRKCKAGPEWERLDLGWAGDGPGVGLLLIENREGSFQHTSPTKEERERVESLILEVGVLVGFDTDSRDQCSKVIEVVDRIRPRESRRSEPAYPDKLYIRCLDGEARFVITVIPK